MTNLTHSRVLLTAVVLVLAAATTVMVAGVTNGFGAGSQTILASCEPAATARQVVQVGLYDAGGRMGGGGMMGAGAGPGPGPMMLRLVPDPSSVSPGRVTFVVTNFGRLDHELVVMPRPADGIGTRPVGADGTVDESGSLGEASTSCGEGAGNGIAPGSRSWVTLTLRPGSYELLCDIPWHYAGGMFAAFTVT